MACKLPILSFNSDGGNEIVTNNLNGKLINEFSPKNGEGIIFYKKNKDTYKKHTNNTIKSILKFDLEKTASSVMNDYKILSNQYDLLKMKIYEKYLSTLRSHANKQTELRFAANQLLEMHAEAMVELTLLLLNLV